ncbi:MAG: hypothetical protein RB292_00875 [Patescibacteria group bacterium]|jgi:hypothetical protein|nr:hypothetical protein [Patescibacteria group bacterium]
MKKMLKKLSLVLAVTVVLAGFWAWAFSLDFTQPSPIFGVTFSNKYASSLGLDWRQSYLAILDDLAVSHLRLVAYWDEIEAAEDHFVFEDLDWQINQATERGRKIILVVGRRLPRWPECHDPNWLSDLSELAIQQQQLEFVRETVNRYKDNAAITAWQVENEPLFNWFGECPKANKNFLKQEIDLVKSLDTRPIIITDSGELNHWQAAAGMADWLGITMYRIVWNKYLGFWDYFFVPSAAYRWKADLTKYWHPGLEKIMVTELQMEPWTLDKNMTDLTIEQQQRSFDLQRFNNNIAYVKSAGFDEVYLWGAEYWYWLKQQNHPEIWDQAKTLW